MSRLPAAISSPANPRVRAAAGLRERRAREQTGRTLIDGAREIGRALDAGVVLETVFVCESLCRSTACLGLLERIGPDDPRVVAVTPAAFARVAFGDRAEGMVAMAITPPVGLDALDLPDRPPGRRPRGRGEAGQPRGDPAQRRRSRARRGRGRRPADRPLQPERDPGQPRDDLQHAPRGGIGRADALAWLREHGLRIVVARVDGSRLYTETDLAGPLAIVLGSEAGGLTAAWSGPGVEAVRLPMLGTADSLNVSVAAGILFYEARRQRDLADATRDRR